MFGVGVAGIPLAVFLKVHYFASGLFCLVC
jgi:hypothetical protein